MKGKLAVLVSVCLLGISGFFLASRYVSGSTDLHDCRSLPAQVVEVSTDDAEKEVTRVCLDPFGRPVRDSLTGSIIEESPPAEEVQE